MPVVGSFSYYAFGRILRSIHDVSPSEVGIDFTHRRTPPSVAFARLEKFSEGRFASLAVLTAAREVVHSIHDLADKTLPALEQTLIHGDAYPDNVVTIARRRMFLVDYDSAGIGPRYWDLAPVVVLRNRFGLPEHEFEAFFAGYGLDLDPRGFDDFQSVVRIREWGVITPLLDRADVDSVYSDELALRLETRHEVGVQWTKSSDLAARAIQLAHKKQSLNRQRLGVGHDHNELGHSS